VTLSGKLKAFNCIAISVGDCESALIKWQRFKCHRQSFPRKHKSSLTTLLPIAHVELEKVVTVELPPRQKIGVPFFHITIAGINVLMLFILFSLRSRTVNKKKQAFTRHIRSDMLLVKETRASQEQQVAVSLIIYYTALDGNAAV